MSDPSNPQNPIPKQTAGIADAVSDVLTEVRPLQIDPDRCGHV